MIIPDEYPDRYRLELIRRLKNWRRDCGWHSFFRTYWRLPFAVATASGLTADKALAVTESLMIEASTLLADFQGKQIVGSFENWFCDLVESHILRLRCVGRAQNLWTAGKQSETDPYSLALESSAAFREWFQENWDREWDYNLQRVALENLRRQIDPLSYQLFHLVCNHGWSSDQIYEHFGIAINELQHSTYLVSEAVLREVSRLEIEVV